MRSERKSIADSIGDTVENLVADLCSDDPRALARVYEAIGGHSSYNNFDDLPEEWTASEFAEWPERGVKLCSDERDKLTTGYVACAMWCGVMAYKHDDDCPCSGEHDSPVGDDACTCEPEMVSSCDAGVGELDDSDLRDDARKELTHDAHEFYADNITYLRASTLTMERSGHNFWLTRNRHGAGFWDDKSRGTPEADAALDRLTEASHAAGSMDLVLGSDGKVGVL